MRRMFLSRSCPWRRPRNGDTPDRWPRPLERPWWAACRNRTASRRCGHIRGTPCQDEILCKNWVWSPVQYCRSRIRTCFQFDAISDWTGCGFRPTFIRYTVLVPFVWLTVGWVTLPSRNWKYFYKKVPFGCSFLEQESKLKSREI